MELISSAFTFCPHPTLSGGGVTVGNADIEGAILGNEDCVGDVDIEGNKEGEEE